MKYTELKIDLKTAYDKVKKMSLSKCKKNKIDKNKTLSDLEMFIVFCFELELKTHNKETIDSEKIMPQVILIKKYIKELKNIH